MTRACSLLWKAGKPYLIQVSFHGLADGSPNSMVILAVFALNIGHPGLAFRNQRKRDVSSDDELSAKA